jgi:hypothetical protein
MNSKPKQLSGQKLEPWDSDGQNNLIYVFVLVFIGYYHGKKGVERSDHLELFDHVPTETETMELIRLS